MDLREAWSGESTIAGMVVLHHDEGCSLTDIMTPRQCSPLLQMCLSCSMAPQMIQVTSQAVETVSLAGRGAAP